MDGGSKGWMEVKKGRPGLRSLAQHQTTSQGSSNPSQAVGCVRLPMVSSWSNSGVVITENLGFETHIKPMCVPARQSLCAMRIMTAHGVRRPSLHDVVGIITVALAWWGLA